MSEEGSSNKKKYVAKKKIRKYKKSECQAELDRLNQLNDTGSDYRVAVQARLKELP
jgi:hypothetical protein